MIDDLVGELRGGGLDVVEGHRWFDKGEFISDAAKVEVVMSQTAKSADGITDVEAFKDDASVYVERSGRVWLFSQARDGVVRIIVNCAKDAKPTVAQKDAVDVLVAVLSTVAFEAEVAE